MHRFTTHSEGSTPQRIGFLLIENFTLLALSSAIDPLRIANRVSGQSLYEWCLVGSHGESVMSSDGIDVQVNAQLADEGQYDLLIVVGGVDIEHNVRPAEIAWLKRHARSPAWLGGICTGTYALALAGLLEGYQCSVHWDCMTPMTERFPNVLCSSQIYTVDRDRITASGGTVSLHMMLAYLGLHHPNALVEAVADMLICDRHRPDHELQLIPTWSRKVALKPKLSEVLQLMEANLEEPIPLSELAGLVGLSMRQLERLFLQNLHCTPSRYYLKLRLDRARRLIRQSSRSIVEITSMCGFVSTTHFSRCYRKHMGLSPRADRKMSVAPQLVSVDKQRRAG